MMMMMMMMMMMIMMIFFCGMVDGQKAFSLIISSLDHCKAGFEPAQNLRLGFDK